MLIPFFHFAYNRSYVKAKRRERENTYTLGDSVLKMNVEQIRLQTFSNWPQEAPVEAWRIAKGGFFATGNGLEVQCHWCGSKIDEWEYGEPVCSFKFYQKETRSDRNRCQSTNHTNKCFRWP